MLRYFIRRVIMVIPVMLGVLTLVFVINSMTPGDPVDQILGEASVEEKEAKREELGLNDPFLVRYGKYVFNFVTKGDLGTSYKTNQPVSQEIMSRMTITVRLALGSVLISVLLGIPLGVVAAMKQYSWLDSVILVLSMVSVSMPGFWLALIFISIFSVNLGILPSAGITDPLGWIMPIAVIGLGCVSSITRITRSSMLEVIRQDYIRTARAKGQSEATITVKHALRSALIPIISSIGNQIGTQLGGALAIEAVFGIPGIGKYIVDAIGYRNYPAVQGGVVMLALVFTLVNLLIDMTYAFVDPRLRANFAVKSKRARLAEKRG